MSVRGIVDAVWSTRPEPPRRRLLWAAAAGIGAHAVLLALMWRTGPSLETWAADVAIRVHQELVRVEAVDLEAEQEARTEPEPADPQPPPEPPPEPPPDVIPPAPSDPEMEPPHDDAPPRAPAPRPAAAAEPLATEPAGPLDLSKDVMVRGSSDAYAGGPTTASGTSDRPVTGPVGGPPGPPATASASTGSSSAAASKPAPHRRDRSAPARPRDADWDCPWPRAADALAIDEESATVRAQLDARGRVLSVQIVSDPGHGFGAAAAECARRARFVPARDVDGRRIPSRTPPIRVQFTR